MVHLLGVIVLLVVLVLDNHAVDLTRTWSSSTVSASPPASAFFCLALVVNHCRIHHVYRADSNGAAIVLGFSIAVFRSRASG